MPDLEQFTLDGQTYDYRDPTKIPLNSKGVANGVASLDENGIILENQLPGIPFSVVNGKLCVTYKRRVEG